MAALEAEVKKIESFYSFLNYKRNTFEIKNLVLFIQSAFKHWVIYRTTNQLKINKLWGKNCEL